MYKTTMLEGSWLGEIYHEIFNDERGLFCLSLLFPFASSEKHLLEHHQNLFLPWQLIVKKFLLHPLRRKDG